MKKLSFLFLLFLAVLQHSFAMAPITGVSTICSGDSTILHDADTGRWVSSDPTIASIDNITGMMHGIAGGTVTIIFFDFGDTARLTVTIIPSPSLSSTLFPATLCDSNVFSYTPTSAVSGTTFAWTRASVPGILGVATSGTGNPLQVMINVTSLPVSLVYVYTLSASGCTNVQNVTVTVNPTPRLSSTLTAPDICDSAVFHYLPTSITPAAQYSWNRPMVSGILPATSFAGMGAGVVSEPLYNTTSSTIAVNYYYRLSIGGCTNSFTETVRVNVLKCTPLLENPIGSSNDVFSIYPNPNSGVFTLALNRTVQSVSVVISDMAGRVTERREIKNAQSNIEAFNLENAAPGNYLVVLTLDGAVYREKVSIW